MFTETELERLFADLRTPEAGRALIRAARANGPVRKIDRNNDCVRTRYISRKMGGRALLAESRTVEFPAIFLRDHDPTVQELWPQPFTADLFVSGTKGGRTRVQHTPDLLLIKESEFLVEEWREEVRLLKLAAERPHLFQKDESG